MDDVSTIGPLWVSQLKKEVSARRNRAEENLLTINPNGSYAAQHRMLIDAANQMLAAPMLVAALLTARIAIETSEDSEPQMVAALAVVDAALESVGAQ